MLALAIRQLSSKFNGLSTVDDWRHLKNSLWSVAAKKFPLLPDTSKAVLSTKGIVDISFDDNLYMKTRVLFSALFRIRLGFLDGNNRMMSIIHGILNTNLVIGVNTQLQFNMSTMYQTPKCIDMDSVASNSSLSLTWCSIVTRNATPYVHSNPFVSFFLAQVLEICVWPGTDFQTNSYVNEKFHSSHMFFL